MILIVYYYYMLPKRKIIRKQYVRPTMSNEGEEAAPASLFDKLKSVDTQIKQEALAYVSSICTFDEGPKQVAILAELIVILYQESTSVVHQCLFGIANLCQIAEWVTARVFQMGLDKALLKLNSNDKNLLKPIMVLMIAICKHIPTQFKYLIEGVQQSLSLDHLASQELDLILSFLICTEAKQMKTELAAKIFEQFNSHQKYKTRCLCLSVLLNNDQIKASPQLIKGLLNFCQEIIGDLNLQKEYATNLMQNKPIVNKNITGQTEIMQQEQPIVQATAHPNYQIFIDAVQANQLLLEEILKILQGQEWSDEQIDEEFQQIAEQKNINSSGSVLKEEVIKFLLTNYGHLCKNASLSFIEGQNIVSLALRLMVLVLPHLSQQMHYQNASINALRAIQTANGLSPPEQIAAEIYISALFIVLKCGVPEEWKQMLLNVGVSILKIAEVYKDCWLFLLELYSIYFNPQKKLVTVDQNRWIGTILKNLIINIPHVQLEQWRAQTIDTLFDVYSNQQFDQIFMELGFVQILQAIKGRVGAGKKKKFIKEVLLDINRFLQYKKKMIQF